MKYELKSIGIWSFTRVAFFINLVFGFLLGLIYAAMLSLFISLPNSPFMRSPFIQLPDAEFGAAPLIGLVIVMPIIAAVMAAVFQTIGGMILVGVYNIISRLTGGLELRLEPTGVNQATPVSQSGYTPPPAPRQNEPRPAPRPPHLGPERPLESTGPGTTDRTPTEPWGPRPADTGSQRSENPGPQGPPPPPGGWRDRPENPPGDPEQNQPQ